MIPEINDLIETGKGNKLIIKDVIKRDSAVLAEMKAEDSRDVINYDVFIKFSDFKIIKKGCVSNV